MTTGDETATQAPLTGTPIENDINGESPYYMFRADTGMSGTKHGPAASTVV